MTPRAKSSSVHRVRARQRRRRELLAVILALADAGQTAAITTGQNPRGARQNVQRETFSASGLPIGRRAP